MLMNHNNGCSLIHDWTLHQIIEDWMTHIEDNSTGPLFS